MASVMDFLVLSDEDKAPVFTGGRKSFFPPKNASPEQKAQWSKTAMPISNLVYIDKFRYPTMQEQEVEVEESGQKVKKKVLKEWEQRLNLGCQLKVDWENLTVSGYENEPPTIRKLVSLWAKMWEREIAVFDKDKLSKHAYADDKDRLAQLQKFHLAMWGPGSDYGLKSTRLSTVVVESGTLQSVEFGAFTTNNRGRKYNKLDRQQFPDLLGLWREMDASGKMLYPPYFTQFLFKWSKQGKQDIYTPFPIPLASAKGRFSRAFCPEERADGSILLPYIVHPGDEKLLSEYVKQARRLTAAERAKLEVPNVRRYPAENGDAYIIALSGEEMIGVNLKETLPEVYTDSVIKGLRGGFRAWEFSPATELSVAGGYKYDDEAGNWVEISQQQILASNPERTEKGVKAVVNGREVEVTHYPGMLNTKPFHPNAMEEGTTRHVFENYKEIEAAAREMGIPIWGDKIERQDPWAFLSGGQSLVQQGYHTPTQVIGGGQAETQIGWSVPGYEEAKQPAPAASPFKRL